jgi:hypothetical protein
MPRLAWVTYSDHALERMAQRRISRADVEAALEFGEGFVDEDDNLAFELRTVYGWAIRVIVVDEGDTARVITAMRLRKAT